MKNNLSNLPSRHRSGKIGRFLFQASTVVGILALLALIFNVINGAFGYAALEYRVDPKTLARDGVSLEEQTKEQLVATLKSKISSGAFNKLEKDQPFADRSRANVYQLVVERIVRYEVDEAWTLWESLTRAEEIKAEYPFYTVDDLILGSLNTKDEGYFDGYTVFDWFRRKAMERGVEYVRNEVVGLDMAPGRVTGVRLASGQTVACGTVGRLY